MRLLVSVASADDARAAVDGGADIIDAKNPWVGALGAVEPDVMRAIHRSTMRCGLLANVPVPGTGT